MARPDLSILSGSIKKLPPGQWQVRMLFAGAPDLELRKHTGVFPATLRENKITHPLFVLRALASGHLVCPCSSRGQKQRQRYIKKNCLLEMSGRTTERDSFLVEKYTFTMPADPRFSRQLLFMGLVPQTCLAGQGGCR